MKKFLLISLILVLKINLSAQVYKRNHKFIEAKIKQENLMQDTINGLLELIPENLIHTQLLNLEIETSTKSNKTIDYNKKIDEKFAVTKILKYERDLIDSLESDLLDTFNLKMSKLRSQQSNNIYDLDRISYQMDIIKTQFKKDKKKLKEIKELRFRILYEMWGVNKKSRLFPTRNTVFNELFYGVKKDKVVSNLENGYVKLNKDIDAGSIYSEFVSGYAGPLRLSFGGLLASSKTVKIDTNKLAQLSLVQIDSLINSVDSLNRTKNSLQRLLGAGGNVVITASIPVYEYSNEDIGLYIDVTAFDKFCIDMPALGSTIEGGSNVNAYGGQLDIVYYFKSKNVFGLFVNGTHSRYNGSSEFYDGLNINSHKTLIVNQIRGGVILDQFNFFIDYAKTSNNDLNKNMEVSFGVGITPY